MTVISPRPVLLCLALTSLTAAWAVRPPETTRLGIEPARVHLTHPDTQAAFARGEPWRAFVEGEGAGWAARFDELTGTPLRMWGPGLHLGPLRTEADVRDAVLSFIDRHAATLGTDGAELVVRSANYEPSLDAWYVDVDTLRADLPIWRGGLTLRFKHDRLVMLGAETYPDVPIVGARVLTARDAQLAAIQQGPAPQADHNEHDASPMLLPWVERGRVQLRTVWRTVSRSEQPLGRWVSFIDAETGELLNVHNTVRFFDGQITAEHDVRLSTGELMRSPLPFASVRSDSDVTFADALGRYTLPDAPTFTVSLDGRRVQVYDQVGIIEPSFTPAPVTDLIAADFGDRVAPASTYVYVHQAQDWAIRVAPEVAWSDARVRAYVNIDQQCNAWYDGQLNFLRSGSGCNNTGRQADVIFHEWGHGFHASSLRAGTFDGSLGEGAADVISFLITDDSRMAPNFYTGGGTLRDADNNRRFPEDYEAGEQSIHQNGMIFSGAMWDAREALRAEYGEPYATDTISRLHAGLLKGGPTIQTAYDEAIFADDDDGDLSNGTPHQCALVEAFSRHGIGPSPVVEHEPISGADALDPLQITASLRSPAPLCFQTDPSAGTLHYRVSGGAWQTSPLTVAGNDVTGALPTAEIGAVIEYWVEVEDGDGGKHSSPAAGPIRPYTFYVGDALVVRCDDFEQTDGGFTHELLSGEAVEGADDWQWARPAGDGTDPSRAASGGNVWGNDLGADDYDGLYQNEKRNRLTSREYNTRHYQGTFLAYQRWLSIEDGVFDQAEIFADDEQVWSNWATDTNTGTDHHLEGEWRTHVVYLNGAGDDGSVQIAWQLTSDQALQFGGWTLDDVCILAPATPDNRLGIRDLRAVRPDTSSPITLSWTHPEHAPLAAVRLVKKSGAWPTGPDDGEIAWSSDTPELGAEVVVTDEGGLGRDDLHFAVYASDGEDWLSWTIEGWNAASVPDRRSGGAGCACQQGAGVGGGLWALTLLLVGVRRRK